uniref:Uncharacterized protein n=1 Tax=Oryctolagus cuniculus TaxID=9986 RepID=A0A5F9CQR9_RABIT
MNQHTCYKSKNTDQRVYLGLSKTQVLFPATAGSSSIDITPLPPPHRNGSGPSPSRHHVLPGLDPGVPICLKVIAESPKWNPGKSTTLCMRAV